MQLVSAFMNRVNSKGSVDGQQNAQNDDEFSPSIEDDSRTLPSSSSKRATGIISLLEPYQHLLPSSLIDAKINTDQQKLLHKALYSAGVSAAVSLQKFIYDAPAAKSAIYGDNVDTVGNTLFDVQPNDSEWKEIFNNLGKFIAMDESGEVFSIISSVNVDEMIKKSGYAKSLMKMISNEVAASALSAFSSATLRRPPTKHIEGLMQNPPLNDSVAHPHENDDEEDEEEDETETKSSLLRSLSGAGKGHLRKCSGCNGVHNLPPSFQNKFKMNDDNSGFNSSPGVAISPPNEVIECCCECCNTDDDDAEVDDEDADTLDADSDSLLRYVCAHEDLAKFLVSARKSAEFTQGRDSTPLMEACCSGHVSLVKMLIEAGADVNTSSSTKNTALIYACASAHVDCVRELLKNGKCDLSFRNDAGHDAMMEAANAGDVEIVKLLIEYGASPSSFSDNSEYKESPLTLAAYKGHLNVVDHLLGIIPKGFERDEELYTALMEAAMDGHVLVSKALLEAGAKTSMPNDSFESPLTLAACGGHSDLVKTMRVTLLLDFGASIEEPNDEGYTPLMEASREGHRSTIEVLLDRGANVNAKIDEVSETPLTLAASGGFRDVVELLVQQGGDLMVGDRTPLFEAVNEGHLDVVRYIMDHLRRSYALSDFQVDLNNSFVCAAETNNVAICNLLLDHGAQINCHSRENRTPLMEAAKQNNLQIVELLINKGAEVNSIAVGNECTALSLAAQNGHYDALKFLLEHGANPNISLKDSYTCLLEASKNGHTRCVELLLTHDGKKKRSSKNEGQQQKSSVVSTSQEKSIEQKSAQLQKGLQKLPQQKCTLNNSGSIKTATTGTVEVTVEKTTRVVTPTGSTTTSGTITAKQVDNLKPQLLAAFAAASTASGLTGNETEEVLLAQLLQSTLSSARKREMMSDDEFRSFIELLLQQFRSLFPSGLDIESLMSGSGEQTLRNICTAVARYEKRGSHPSGSSTASSGSTVTVESASSDLVGEITVSGEAARALDAISSALHSDSGSPKKASHDQVSLQKCTNVNNSDERQKTGLKKRAAAKEFIESHTCCEKAHIQQMMSKLEELELDKHHPCCRASSPTATTVLPKQLNKRSQSKSVDSKTIHSNSDKPLTSRGEKIGAVGSANTQTESNNDTALTLACVGGHAPVVKLLLGQGADIEHRDKKGFTPLILAASGGHIDVCKLLIDVGALVDACADRTKDTALSMACSGGRKEVAELLIKHGANKEHRNLSDYTPLSLAASGGFVDVIQLLLNNGAEINSRTGSKLGISPLMLAAMNGHESATQLLLDSGSDINAQIETNRNTALTLACFQGRSEVTKLLIKYGANVEHRAKTGLTPLMEAATGGYVEVGELLIQSGADVNASPVPSSRDTALTIAADKGHASFVQMLIHSDAQINARNKKGCSALWRAAAGGHIDAVQILVKHNVDTEAQDNRRLTPLMVAFRKGHVKVVKYMVKHVTQYPNDQECIRYVATLNDQDLATKCRQCVELIQSAKKKQEQEADKAAASLLAMLAQEEAMEASKKATKQRQKEKKKAKKQAKKAMLNIDEADDDVIDQKQENIRDNDCDVNSRGNSSSPALLLENQTSIRNVNSYSDDELDENNTSDQKQKASSEGFEDEAPRVPAVEVRLPSPVTSESLSIQQQKLIFHNSSGIDSNTTIGSSSSKRTSSNHTLTFSQGSATHNSQNQPTTGNSRRRQRGRGGRFRNVSNNLESEYNGTKSGNFSTLLNTGNGCKSTTEETNEWLRASKKRASVNKNTCSMFGSIDPPLPLAPPLVKPTRGGEKILKQPMHYDDERRMCVQVLDIISNCVPRIIGRAGVNINAIREATDAHIEVEKMSKLKVDQPRRKITIRGNTETIKNCIRMIEILVREAEADVDDIVQRVMSRRDRSFSPSLVSFNTSVSQPKLPCGMNAAAQQSPLPPNQQHPQQTNVWQQRAQQRERQKCTSTFSITPPTSSTLASTTQKSVISSQQSNQPALVSISIPQQHPSAIGSGRPSQHQHNNHSPLSTVTTTLATQSLNSPPTTSIAVQQRVSTPPQKHIDEAQKLPDIITPVGTQHLSGKSAKVSETNAPAIEELIALEEHQRKAPGYGAPRPASTAITTDAQKQLPTPIGSNKPMRPLSDIWAPSAPTESVSTEDSGISSTFSLLSSALVDDPPNLIGGPLNFNFSSSMNNTTVDPWANNTEVQKNNQEFDSLAIGAKNLGVIGDRSNTEKTCWAGSASSFVPNTTVVQQSHSGLTTSIASLFDSFGDGGIKQPLQQVSASHWGNTPPLSGSVYSSPLPKWQGPDSQQRQQFQQQQTLMSGMMSGMPPGGVIRPSSATITSAGASVASGQQQQSFPTYWSTIDQRQQNNAVSGGVNSSTGASYKIQPQGSLHSPQQQHRPNLNTYGSSTGLIRSTQQPLQQTQQQMYGQQQNSAVGGMLKSYMTSVEHPHQVAVHQSNVSNVAPLKIMSNLNGPQDYIAVQQIQQIPQQKFVQPPIAQQGSVYGGGSTYQHQLSAPTYGQNQVQQQRYTHPPPGFFTGASRQHIPTAGAGGSYGYGSTAGTTAVRLNSSQNSNSFGIHSGSNTLYTPSSATATPDAHQHQLFVAGLIPVCRCMNCQQQQQTAPSTGKF